jgi:hypothetical protein
MQKKYPTPDPKPCDFCGTVFQPDGWDVAHGKGKYCSPECSYKARGPSKITLKCKWCGKDMVVSGHRTDQCFHKKCRAEYRKSQRPWIPCAFPGCNEKFQDMPWVIKAGRIYCDKHTKAANKSHFPKGEAHPNWAGGISFGKYCPKFRPVRPRVRAFFNYRCMMPGCTCGGFTKDSNPQPVVHHVYYQKEACCYRTENGEFVFDLGKYGTIKVEGDPTKFVTLCGPANSRVNRDRLKWAQYFENLINIEYGGKSYFTEEEYKRFLADQS